MFGGKIVLKEAKFACGLNVRFKPKYSGYLSNKFQN